MSVVANKCEIRKCLKVVSPDETHKSIGLTGQIFCSMHLIKRERRKFIVEAIFRYMKNGQSMNDMVENTNITHYECMESLDFIEDRLKK